MTQHCWLEEGTCCAGSKVDASVKEPLDERKVVVDDGNVQHCLSRVEPPIVDTIALTDDPKVSPHSHVAAVGRAEELWRVVKGFHHHSPKLLKT
eukprot:CAMPEP_0206281442 /NCGR_PEP_ID=MMETSP0047_2-20121206/39129_1 /ASSEMBLY_ACC=CAM_ASM_000192 /TAXON_ID=195065 /ORGANISM="Chroomonas mesostigmatica_cf, Strain CCMP1168" /LENGTH=93 /DNA_ID=CAMNT_0053711601 /DNA_START=200 /DNA_END=481 /DNA_ORIENTATION=-